jgi:hypothetical protein
MPDSLIAQLTQQILQRPLTSLEVLILVGSWQGDRYGQMAGESGYGEEYIKQVGAKLWTELSLQLGVTVTKKKLRLIFTDLATPPSNQDPNQTPPLVQIEDESTLSARLGLTTSSISHRIAPIPDSLVRALNRYNLSVGDSSSTDGSPAKGSLSFPSGPLPLNSDLYIYRPLAEEIALAEINRPGCLLCIKAPRRFGKTSLLRRVMVDAMQKNYQVCLIDLLEADRSILGSTETFLRWFCRRISYSLGLPSTLDKSWDTELGSKVNCGIYLQNSVLPQVDRPLVLAINALDQAFIHESLTQDLLSMLRFWHEQSKDDRLWSQLRLVLVYATDSYVPLNLEYSPFDVGRSIQLPCFTLEQFIELARRYHLNELDQPTQQRALETLYHLIAGHPYLVNLSFYALKQEGKTLDEVLNTATAANGVFGAHLQELLIQLRQNQRILQAFQRVLQEPGLTLKAIDLLQLEGLGLIRIEGGGVHPLCELYQRFFAEQLDGT